MGAGGIAFAGTLAFTAEALMLLWLLRNRYPGILRSRDTLLRVIAASALGALVAYGLLAWAPIPALFASLAGMLLGLVITIPFILPELTAFMHLGRQTTEAPLAEEPLLTE
jgi:peptidoglycan biosynthesis protein MviN/MurJ (putative lipid II flippase)